MVFSTPNIVTAICIESGEGTIMGTDVGWSKTFLIGAVIMLVGTHIASTANAR